MSMKWNVNSSGRITMRNSIYLLSSLLLLLCNTGFYVTAELGDNLSRYKSYNKYTIFNYNEEAFNYMVDLQMNETDLDFWLLTRNMTIVSVAPQIQPIFEQRLQQLSVDYKVMPLMDEMMSLFVDPVNETCLQTNCEIKRTRRQASGFFTYFPRYSEILNFMSVLAARYPQYCRYETLGRTYEGRHIVGLSISLNSRKFTRRVAYIQGTTHGREWIAPLTVMYFANELLTNIRAFQRILDDTEIYLVPLVNPDGYEYTHTRDRFWRKNRHRYAGKSCSGVDINRNFANHWNEHGSSQNLCSEVYSGTSPNSEAETAAIVRYLQNNRNRVKLSVDVHSFGNFIFYPFGYSRTAYAPTRSFLHSVAQRAANQIAKYRGTRYTVGTSAGILYEASGGLDDYAYGNLGVPMSFTLELPGENFQVAQSDILHICKETFAGFVELVRHVSLF